MFTSAQIWSAVDMIARQNGLSRSGLARKAGLDPTALNTSKRIGRAGNLRWLSTGTLARILAATGSSFDEFCRLVQRRGDEPDMDVVRENGKTKWPSPRETILIVHPDEAFGTRAAAQLGASGYNLFLARDVPHALALLDSGLAIDLLITGMTLPSGLQGAELAHIARLQRSGIKLLFVASGADAPQPDGPATEIIADSTLDDGGLTAAAARLLGVPQRGSGNQYAGLAGNGAAPSFA
jgi:CheY-like chemotaxis protein